MATVNISTTNEAARQAFKERQENGLNLLQKVWKYSDQFKVELEMGLDVGIRNGESADEKYQMPQLNL